MSKYEEFRNPWEEQKEGFWIVHKSKGCTSMKKIAPEQGTEELAAFHYAMAISYGVMVDEFLKLSDSGKPYSINDVVLNTITAVGKVVNERRNNNVE